MTVNKRKKVSRQRASHTHGWGSMKKHRGSGHKGGAGMSGTGKRADSKKPSFWKERYFGRRGFRVPGSDDVKAINISDIEERLPALLGEGVAREENGVFYVDIGKKGYGKLLGSGRVARKMVITAGSASKGAVRSVKEAGGEVVLPQKKSH
ncbi:uL15 family ribosomal protein [Candidatus Woesearchaeota archaeon]|nr:uL15 family ribosomal protein [Candidatus Woesearchaeota archaeon]